MKGPHRLAVPVASTAVANGAITAISALGGVVIARELGPAGRGDFAIVLVSFAIVQVFAEGGVQGATTFFAARRGTNRRELIQTSGRMLFVQAVIAATVSALVLVALGERMTDRTAFFVMLVGLIPTLWLSARLFALQAIKLPYWNAARLSQSLIYLGLLTVLSLASQLDVITAAATFATSNVLAGALAALITRRLVRNDEGELISVARIRSYAVPNLAWTVPVTLSARIDQVALAVFASSADLGIYAVALSLMTLTMPVVAAIGNVTMPALSRLESEGVPTGSRMRHIVAIGAAVATVTSVAIAAASVVVIPTLFGDSFAESVTISWLLVPATVAYGTKWVAADSLRGMNLPAAAAKSEWTGLVVVVALTLPMTAIFGLTGAALTPTLGFLVAVFMMMKAGSGRTASRVEQGPHG